MEDQNTKLILNAISKTNENLEQLKKEMNDKFDAIDNKFNTVDGRFDAIDTEIGQMKEEMNLLSNSVARIEVEHGEKIQIALDYIAGAIQQHEEMMKILNKINLKLDNHEIRITALEDKVI